MGRLFLSLGIQPSPKPGRACRHLSITLPQDTRNADHIGYSVARREEYPSAQPEKAEHNDDDDDRTDKPDDSVRDGCPLMARVWKAGRAYAHQSVPA